ncbi:MAG: STAS domain-containing protein [Thermoanaerobaculia bacterium]
MLELGGEEYPGLRDLVRGQIEKGRPHLILDLSSVERIDSNGVGEIVAVWQHAKNQGGELVLAGLKPRIRDIFEILYLDKVIPIFDTVIEAAIYLARSSDEPPGSTDSG